jgi:hypothetical protein
MTVLHCSWLFLQFVQGFFEQAHSVFAWQQELPGFDGQLHSKGLETANLFGLQQARRLSVDVAAAALHGADDSVALKVLIGTGHGVGIDAQLGGELAYGREGIVLTDSLRGDGLLYLGFDLQVERNSGCGMDSNNQDSPSM